MRSFLLFLLLLSCCSLAPAQHVMNNKDVRKLVDNGLADAVILHAIESTPGVYDISSSAMNLLSDAGASRKVLDAMRAKPPASAAELSAPVEVPREKMANVHFYRYKQMQGSGLRPSVYCDAVQVARIADGRYLDIAFAAGDHVFYADDKQSGAAVTLEAGKDYYFRTDLQVGFWKGHFRLSLVAPEQGKYDLSKLKPMTDREYEFPSPAAPGK